MKEMQYTQSESGYHNCFSILLNLNANIPTVFFGSMKMVTARNYIFLKDYCTNSECLVISLTVKICTGKREGGNEYKAIYEDGLLRR